MNFPDRGLKLLLTSDNIDGLSNELMRHGTDVPAWHDQSANPIDFVQDDPRGWALFKQTNYEKCVRTDGDFDRLTGVGSKTKLSFLHNPPAKWEILLVLRRIGGMVQGPGIIFGGSGGQTAGVLVFFDVTPSEGFLRLSIGNGIAFVIDYPTPIFCPVGDKMKIHIKSDGAKILVSTDFRRYYESPAFTGAPAAGDAVTDYSVAAGQPAQPIPPYPKAQADFYLIAIADRSTTAFWTEDELANEIQPICDELTGGV